MPDRELGGYASSPVLGGAGISLREIAVIISPAAGTNNAVVEQTFTVPGVLASDRLAYLAWTSQAFAANNGTSSPVFPLAGRVSAISVVSIPFMNSGGSAATPTTSASVAFGIASARVIP